jgi:cysteine desulfurase
MKTRSYLDYNASTPLRPQARQAMIEAFDRFGNPSSVHREGRDARALIEQARGKVARLAGARADQVVFTSGGSEANALALHQGKGAVCVSAIEHPSVLANAGPETDGALRIPVTRDGLIDCDALAGLAADPHLKDTGTPLFSVMYANNETGAIQPVGQAAAIVHEAGGWLHSDAVQAAGRISLDFEASGADLISLSAHKIGGPKGVGALIVRDGFSLAPLFRGGGQERRLRPGTENVSGIAGFGAAAECAVSELAQGVGVGALRQSLERQAVAAVPDAVVFADAVPRLPNTVLIAVPGTQAETLVIGLDLTGVAVSSGAACSSGRVEPSHVLHAMGVAPDLAQGAIRVSLGWDSDAADIERFLSAWTGLVMRTRGNRAAA